MRPFVLTQGDLQSKIEKARQEFRDGKTISLRSHEDVDRYFEEM